MENSFNIGERIRELRTIRGLSQEQLALRSDITPTYLGQIERNAKNPTVKIIEQLSDTRTWASRVLQSDGSRSLYGRASFQAADFTA